MDQFRIQQSLLVLFKPSVKIDKVLVFKGVISMTDKGQEQQEQPVEKKKGIELTPTVENPDVKTGTAEVTFYFASDSTPFTDLKAALAYEDLLRSVRGQ
ncbi:hypothetical protein HY045_01625 [Candidatus Woesebacteria bacterium]|nr:hypothetical protein [Candidatus Woesebacteria bacterium]